MEESQIWKGRPSQWINFQTYLLCFLFSWLIIPIFIAIWHYLVVRTWDFEVTSERLIINKGVLSRTTDELELYRVKDTRLLQPFWLRLVGLSNIILSTSDRSHKTVLIPGLNNGKELREQIRKAVEIRRDHKKVREVDFE